ncbi:MAG: response regulator transcription factor [Desulfobacteraceae bacterium]|nr:response regulator transcription factor [Desulfobacteraceae bacterium]
MNTNHNESQVKEPIILITEDHDALRKSLREWVCTNFPNVRVLEAKSGEAALSLAHAYQPDIILMDIGLPRMNGLEATRRIKKALPLTKVVILTIHENPEYQDDAEAAGASAYVPKRKMGAQLGKVMTRLLSLSLDTASLQG